MKLSYSILQQTTLKARVHYLSTCTHGRHFTERYGEKKYREELKILTFNPQTEWCCHLEEHANAQSSCLYS